MFGSLLFCQCCYYSLPTTQIVSAGEYSNYHHKKSEGIETKLKACYQSMNIHYMLNERMYWLKAKADAENVISTFQSLISQQKIVNSKSLCWNATLILNLDKDGILRGSIGADHTYVEFNVSDVFLEDKRKYYQNMISQKIAKLTKDKDFIYSNILCIPRVFLAGHPKCGSTALDDLLTTHPKINHGLSKEPRWWVPPLHHPNMPHSFKVTASYFVKYLLQYQYDLMKSNDILLLDSSPNLMTVWYNIGYDEKYEDICLLPTVISTLIPNAQFIVILRDPIDFLYSTFWFRCSSKVLTDYNLTEKQAHQGPTVFHNLVQHRLTQFKKCSHFNNYEKCILEQYLIEDEHPDYFQCGRVPLGMAVYYIHIIRWFSVFPREQFYFLTAEEFFQAPFSTVQKIWKFLNLSPPDKLNYTSLKRRLLRSRNTQVRFDYHNDPNLQMLPQTHTVLKQFFKKFNAILATLLNSKKYLWNKK